MEYYTAIKMRLLEISLVDLENTQGKIRVGSRRLGIVYSMASTLFLYIFHPEMKPWTTHMLTKCSIAKVPPSVFFFLQGKNVAMHKRLKRNISKY